MAEAKVPSGLWGKIEKLIDDKIAAFARSGFLRNASVTGGAGLSIRDGGSLNVEGGDVNVTDGGSVAVAGGGMVAVGGGGGIAVTDGGGITIENGGRLAVKDAEGDRRLHAGELDDGTYGLAVFDDNGRPLSLAQLAFGQVATEASIETGGANLTYAQHDSGTGFGTGWRAAGTPLFVDVLVTSGRLRVDLSTALTITLATGLAAGSQAAASMSYVVLGPTETAADLNGTPPTAAPADTMRAVSDWASTVTGRAELTASNFGTHTDLPAGWYRVATRYGMTYNAGARSSAQASFSGQRITALPY